MMKDTGPNPLIVNIEDLTLRNTNFRTTLWTGAHMQLTVMSLKPGEEIGLEVHEDHDQFIRIEEGEATAYLGSTEDSLEATPAAAESVVMVPAGQWHNLVNTGSVDLKLYSIYSPAEHEHGTVHVTKAEADADEHEH